MRPSHFVRDNDKYVTLERRGKCEENYFLALSDNLHLSVY